MEKDLTKLNNLYFAHRGLHDISKGIPENSLLSFKKAINQNIAIELDIHLLKDGEIIVFHDDNLKRMTNFDRDVNVCTWDEIKDLKLLNTDETIPLLRDVLALVNNQVLLNVELKSTTKVGELEKEASKLLDKYKGDFTVQSFRPTTVKWFKDNRPNYIRGQLSCDYFKDSFRVLKEVKEMGLVNKFIATHMLLNFITKPDYIGYHLNSMTKRQARKWMKKYNYLMVWTIRTEKDMKLAKELGNIFVYENINIK